METCKRFLAQNSLAVVMLLGSLWSFLSALRASASNIAIVYYNRGSPVTPQHLYVFSVATFLMGSILIARKVRRNHICSKLSSKEGASQLKD
jgi:hypothetical protein